MASASLRRAGIVESFVVAALEQTAGRGRQGRTWESARALGVYLSLVVSGCRRRELTRLPLLGGVALCRALEPLVSGSCGLKWPNDLIVGGRKMGGLLIETLSRPDRGDGVTGGSSVSERTAASSGTAATDGTAVPGEACAILGIGVNYGHQRGDLPVDGATSLELERGAPLPPLGRLAGLLVAALESELGHLSDAGYAIRAYEELSIHRPGEPLACRTPARRVEGRFVGFDRSGHLRLETSVGVETISSGEVSSLP